MRLLNHLTPANQLAAKETDLSHPQTRSSPKSCLNCTPPPDQSPLSRQATVTMAQRDPQYARISPSTGPIPVSRASRTRLTSSSLGEQVQPEAPRGHHADARPYPKGRGDWYHVCIPS